MPSPPPASNDSEEATLQEALQTISHGAVISMPSLLAQRGMLLLVAAVLTNGYGATAYGLFALAERLQRFLQRIAIGYRRGLSRFLPVTDDRHDRNLIITVAGIAVLGIASVFGMVTVVFAPIIARVTIDDPSFITLLRVFGGGLPIIAAIHYLGGVFRGIEAIIPLTLLTRIFLPLSQLGIAVFVWAIGGSILHVAIGIIVGAGFLAVGGFLWLMYSASFRPILGRSLCSDVAKGYLKDTTPMFGSMVATTIQLLGFYPLIALFLSGTAGGVFTIGLLVGQLVRLPLSGINQLMSPVAATLYGDDQIEALQRLYQVSSRLVLIGTVFFAAVGLMYRREIMLFFGPSIMPFAWVLPAFVLAQLAASSAGSVGILLMMTDNQRTHFTINLGVTLLMIPLATMLTIYSGLAGLVSSYFIMLLLNNVAELLALYRLEGLYPASWSHLHPFITIVPVGGIFALFRWQFEAVPSIVGGVLIGGMLYIGVLRVLGFDPLERTLVSTLLHRYREMLTD